MLMAAAPAHDLFDWWASIWIPAIASVVALVGAVASFFVALAALRVSRRATDLEAKRSELDDRQWRHEQVPALQAWLREMAHEPEDAYIWDKIKPVRAQQELLRLMTARGDEAGTDMVAWLQWRVGTVARGDERMTAEMKGSTMIDDWAADPANVTRWMDAWDK